MSDLRLICLRVAVDRLRDDRLSETYREDATKAREWAISALNAMERGDSSRWVDHCLKRATEDLRNGFHPRFKDIMMQYRSGGETAIPASSLLVAVADGTHDKFVAQWANWDTFAQDIG